MTARPSAAVKAQRAARAALDRKALDLVVLDVQGAVERRPTTSWSAAAGRPRTWTRSPTRSAPSSRRRACAPLHAEGAAESGWVLLDYGDVLMHVFLEDTRVVLRARAAVGRRAVHSGRRCVMRVLHALETAC